MAIDFPNSPTSGDSYTVGDKSWQWDGAKWIADGAFISPSILKVDQANSRVGIGTASPQKILHVEESDSGVTAGGSHHLVVESSVDNGILIASGTTSNGRLRFGDSDSAVVGGFDYDHANDSLKIRTAGTDHLTINSSGNVGIGTTTPTLKFQVNGTAGFNDSIQTGASSFTLEPWSSQTIALGNFGYVGTEGAYQLSLAWNYERGTDSGWHSLGVNSFTSAAGVDLGNDGIIFRMDSSYGATAPPTEVGRFDANGHFEVGGTTQPGTDAVMYTEGVVSSYNPTTSTTGVLIKAYSDVGGSQSLKFDVRADGDITTDGGITAAGNVGIGVTAPLRSLDVLTDILISNGNPAYLWHMTSSNNLGLYYKTAAGDTGWSTRVHMTPTATAWAAGSDRRIKRDIVDHDGDLAEILNLRVRSYNFNDDAADQPARYGFITDEVPDSLGHLVTGEAGAVTIDEETGEETPDPQGLFYADLIPHLVGAIQELSARIETLETA